MQCSPHRAGCAAVLFVVLAAACSSGSGDVAVAETTPDADASTPVADAEDETDPTPTVPSADDDPTPTAPTATPEPFQPPGLDGLTDDVVQSTLINARNFNGDYCRSFQDDVLVPDVDRGDAPLYARSNAPGDGGEFFDVCFGGVVDDWPVLVTVTDSASEIAGSVELHLTTTAGALNYYSDVLLVAGVPAGDPARYSGVYVSQVGAEHVEVPMLLPLTRRSGTWTVSWQGQTESHSATFEVEQRCPGEQGPSAAVFSYPPGAWPDGDPGAYDNCELFPDYVGTAVEDAVADFANRTSLFPVRADPSQAVRLVATADCLADQSGVVVNQFTLPGTQIGFFASFFEVDYTGPCPTLPDFVGSTVTDAEATIGQLQQTFPHFWPQFIGCAGSQVIGEQFPRVDELAGTVQLRC